MYSGKRDNVMISRRHLLAMGAGTALTGFGIGSGRAVETDALGLAGDLGTRLDLGHRAGLLTGLHAVHVRRRGELAFERYFSGPDQDWGRPLGDVTFDAKTLHDLRSVSKSVTSLLYGIAEAKGLVPAPEAPLMASFPQYEDLVADPARAKWTIGHVLNMTLGIAWNENLPYTNPANSEIQMENAADRYRFILSRDIVAPAGQRWNYNGGCTALLAYLIEKGSGLALDQFAQQELFRPLGIDAFDWNRGRDGAVSAASGLRLSAPALARLGDMMLAGGKWQDRQVVPAPWISALNKPAATTNFGLGYRNQWYLSRQMAPKAGGMKQMISAMGNGGQRLYILPELDLSIAVFAGNYNRRDQWMTPTLVLQRIILPAIRPLK